MWDWVRFVVGADRRANCQRGEARWGEVRKIAIDALWWINGAIQKSGLNEMN